MLSARLLLSRCLRSLQLPLLLATSSTALAQQAATFGAVTTYGTGGSRASGLAVADVNGDGKPDLLTLSTISNTVSVLLGTGTGSFGAVTTFSTGVNSRPLSLVVADVNGDGKADVLTANSYTDAVGVLLGTGTGSFGAVIMFSTGVFTQPYDLAVADVNGDGKADVLTANWGTNSAGVLLGTGTGSFGTATIYSTGANSLPYNIAVADVNGDGKPDLLTANSTSSTAGVLLGTGTGSFGAVTAFGTGTNSYPHGIAVADVNGDRKLDLLTANTNSTAGVLLGTGTGSFGAATTFSTGSSSQSNDIAVADVNGDGQPDLLTANFNTNSAGVLLGTGTGSFGAVTQFSMGGSSLPSGIVAADVNGDGKPDLLTANSGSSSAAVLLNTTPTLTLGTLSPGSSASADLTFCPNPASHGAATLTGANPGQAVLVLDVLGQVSATVTADVTGKAALGGLAPGLYLVRAGSRGGRLAVE